MQLSQLIYFKTVAETGKLSLASKKLSVTAPALSIAIRNLENELGTPLFDRDKNQIALNERGKAYLCYVNRVLADLDLAKEEVRNMSAQTLDDIEVAL